MCKLTGTKLTVVFVIVCCLFEQCYSGCEDYLSRMFRKPEFVHQQEVYEHEFVYYCDYGWRSSCSQSNLSWCIDYNPILTNCQEVANNDWSIHYNCSPISNINKLTVQWNSSMVLDQSPTLYCACGCENHPVFSCSEDVYSHYFFVTAANQSTCNPTPSMTLEPSPSGFPSSTAYSSSRSPTPNVTTKSMSTQTSSISVSSTSTILPTPSPSVLSPVVSALETTAYKVSLGAILLVMVVWTLVAFLIGYCCGIYCKSKSRYRCTDGNSNRKNNVVLTATNPLTESLEETREKELNVDSTQPMLCNDTHRTQSE